MAWIIESAVRLMRHTKVLYLLKNLRIVLFRKSIPVFAPML